MERILTTLGLDPVNPGATTGGPQGWLTTGGEMLTSVSPIDGQPIARIQQATADDYDTVVATAREAFEDWRRMPAPRRGEVVRQIGLRLREAKEALGALITLEAGKIVAEGQGEVHNIIAPVLAQHGLQGVFNLVIGRGAQVGEAMLNDSRLPLVSATGSTRMGRHAGATVARRLGRSLLELGGNNAIIVCEDADLDLALRATVFGAVGTAGQRCTSTRRIIVHSAIRERFIQALKHAYAQVRVGDPRQSETLMGPLIDAGAVEQMMTALEQARAQGGQVLCGGEQLERVPGGYYVEPTLVAAENDDPIVQTETFAPILYIMAYEALEDALRMHNDVPQGLSSAIFTASLHHSEAFLAATGSDCGLANVNIGTSGAEIGGAFGDQIELRTIVGVILLA